MESLDKNEITCGQHKDRKESAETVYKRRAGIFLEKKKKISTLIRKISALRLIVFFSGISVFFWFPFVFTPVLISIYGALTIVFFTLVLYHHGFLEKRNALDCLERINTDAIFRLHRDWNRMPPSAGIPVKIPELAVDLDIVGSASLLRLIGTTYTLEGRTMLFNWLCGPALPEDILKRQEAVIELVPRIDFRQSVEKEGKTNINTLMDSSFLNWIKTPFLLLDKPGIIALINVFTTITPVTLLLWGTGMTNGLPLMFCLTVNSILSLRYIPSIHRVFGRTSRPEREFRCYSAIIQSITAESFNSSLLREYQDILVGPCPAHTMMKKLDRIVQCSELKFTPMFYLPFQILFLWDFHVLQYLERWKKLAGPYSEKWLSVIGAVEALSALAVLKHDHTDWAFPIITDNKGSMVMVGFDDMGHPLLHPGKCVCNSLTLGRPGTFFLVTGSNMSGKSTFLRALGLNLVLAQAGGPVCARQMSLPPLDLSTSFRVNDSLEKGESFFMAELRRIKKILDSAQNASVSDRIPFFLLDEILLGTNADERRIAVRIILENLLDKNAMGLISSHDLSLSEINDFAKVRTTVHFAERFTSEKNKGEFVFDYKLRAGVSKTVNALRLLETVGINPIQDRDPS